MREQNGFRSPLEVALVYPVMAGMVFWFVVVSVMFTVWPGALEHAPVSFEERGVIHHIWHYSLLAGALATATGMLWTSQRRTLVEILGLLMLICAVTLNLIAVVGDGLTDGLSGSLEGWDMALRLGILTGLALRVYVLAVEPVIEVPVQTETKGL